jgi:hypothetical protein
LLLLLPGRLAHMSASKVLKLWEAACQSLSGVTSTAASPQQLLEVGQKLQGTANTKVHYDVRTVEKLVKAKVSTQQCLNMSLCLRLYLRLQPQAHQAREVQNHIAATHS